MTLAAGDPGAARSKSKGALLLGAIAAFEAVVIVALLVTREPPPDAQRESPAHSARAAADDQAAEPPTFVSDDVAAPKLDERAPSLPSASTAARESLVAPALEGGAAGIVLYGSVADAGGGPIDDELVALGFSDRDAEVVPERGAWSAAGFAPGTVTVTCMALGFLSQTVEVTLDASRPVERRDFRLEAAPAILVAFRTPDGQPLLPQLDAAMIPGDLRAYTTLEAPGGEWTDATPLLGSWLRFAREPRPEDPNVQLVAQGWTGLIRPHRPPPFFVNAVWGRQVLASEAVTSADARVTFTFALDTFFAAMGSVRARVVDRADRRAVAGLLATLDGVLLDVEDDGSVLFEHVVPGKHVLRLFPPGGWQHLDGGTTVMHAPGTGEYERLELPVECRAGQQLDLGEVEVRRTVSVRGRLTNSAGMPIVASISVTPADAAAGATAGGATLHPQVDERGGFIVSVVPGRWRFAAGPDSTALPRVVDVTGTIDDLVLIGVGAPVGN